MSLAVRGQVRDNPGMVSLDFTTTILLTALVGVAFALVDLLIARVTGQIGAVMRMSAANLVLVGGLVWRAVLPTPVAPFAYVIVWSSTTIAPLVFISALRHTVGLLDRDREMAVLGLIGVLVLVASAAWGSGQAIALAASITSGVSFLVGLRAAREMKSPALRLPKQMLTSCFALCIVFCVVHVANRCVDIGHGLHEVPAVSGTYVGTLVLTLTLNLALITTMYLKLAERIGNLAHIDELTLLLNRRGLSASLNAVDDHGKAIVRGAIVIMDIDHFKRVNDKWGHAIGDQVLREFAHRLSSLARECDLAVRLGGEEFALVLSGCDISRAVEIAQALRFDLASREMLLAQGLPMKISASFGIADFDLGKRRLDGDIQRADEALYAAKRGGRDQVVVWQPAQAPIAGAVDDRQEDDCLV